MKATILIPTGIDNSAEIRAMCSFPAPEARERATSNSPERRGFNFCCISSLSCNSGREWFIMRVECSFDV